MADGLAWDDDDFEVPELGATVGEQALAEADNKKFEGEDEEEDEVEQPRLPREPNKAKQKKVYADKGAVPVEERLDDPVAEKLRQQRLQEESDFQNTLDAFGDDYAFGRLQKFIPKSEKDFEEYVQLLVARFFTPYKTAKHYKFMMKQILRSALDETPAQEVKDLETCLVGIRQKRGQLEKKAEMESSSKKGKKYVNVGKDQGSAGLEDYIYDDPLDDEYDFM